MTTPTGPMTTTTLTPSDVHYWGEEGQWLAAEGHHDLDTFAAAAAQRWRDDTGDATSLTDGNDPRHEWYRPITRAWFEENLRRPEHDDHAARQWFHGLADEGCLEPCGPDDEGAEPWTVVMADV